MKQEGVQVAAGAVRSAVEGTRSVFQHCRWGPLDFPEGEARGGFGPEGRSGGIKHSGGIVGEGVNYLDALLFSSLTLG